MPQAFQPQSGKDHSLVETISSSLFNLLEWAFNFPWQGNEKDKSNDMKAVLRFRCVFDLGISPAINVR